MRSGTTIQPVQSRKRPFPFWLGRAVRKTGLVFFKFYFTAPSLLMTARVEDVYENRTTSSRFELTILSHFFLQLQSLLLVRSRIKFTI